MVRELLRRVVSLASDVIELCRPIEGPRAGMTPVDEDVLAALVNLGCARPQAEAAVRKAKAAGPANDFEPLFRRALELVR